MDKAVAFVVLKGPYQWLYELLQLKLHNNIRKLYLVSSVIPQKQRKYLGYLSTSFYVLGWFFFWFLVVVSGVFYVIMKLVVYRSQEDRFLYH